jgi:hypothetical protein
MRNIMKKRVMLCLLPGLLFAAGCSKEPEVTDDYSMEEEYTPAPSAALPADQPLARQLDTAHRALEERNYKVVVDRFDAMSRVPKTIEEERAYRQAMHETMEKLREQAEVDPAAEQVYRNFGRRMMGR